MRVRTIKTNPVYEDAYAAYWNDEISLKQLDAISTSLHRRKVGRSIPRAKRYMTILRQRIKEGVIDDITLQAAEELVRELHKYVAAQKLLATQKENHK